MCVVSNMGVHVVDFLPYVPADVRASASGSAKVSCFFCLTQARACRIFVCMNKTRTCDALVMLRACCPWCAAHMWWSEVVCLMTERVSAAIASRDLLRVVLQRVCLVFAGL
jgi:hypothetical protein